MPTPRPTFVPESSLLSAEELEVAEVSVADVAEAVASEADEDVVELVDEAAVVDVDGVSVFGHVRQLKFGDKN